MQLAVRLLLLRNCPAMEAAPQRLREQLTVALKQLAVGLLQAVCTRIMTFYIGGAWIDSLNRTSRGQYH